MGSCRVRLGLAAEPIVALAAEQESAKNAAPMNILLWRGWSPRYPCPATFSSLAGHSIGGTCSQLLWHASNLAGMGHAVQVIGATQVDLVEEGVEFVGAADRDAQQVLVRSGRIRRPVVIFLEGAYHAAPWLHSLFPAARIVHVGQNIDHLSPRAAFEVSACVDVYGMVSPGQLAEQCMRRPSLRHKFALLRNVTPWHRFLKHVVPRPVEDRVAWVGSWGKKGLRQWAETMERVLADFPTYRWDLYGPTYDVEGRPLPAFVLSQLRIPQHRVAIMDRPITKLAEEISAARVVLVSLGNETACISALDAHAMARPVLSGNDTVFKYNNPEGTGVRVFRAHERYAALAGLLQEPAVCDKMGALGKAFVTAERTETEQAHDLRMILGYLDLLNESANVRGPIPPSRAQDELSYLSDKVMRRIYGALG